VTTRVTAITMGHASPASVAAGTGYYEYRKLPGWKPNDPRCRQAPVPTATDAEMEGLRARGQQSSAEKAARLEKFAGFLKEGLTAPEAGRRLSPPVSPKTARAYARQIRQRQEAARTAETSAAEPVATGGGTGHA
jgi:hypothetical protein